MLSFSEPGEQRWQGRESCPEHPLALDLLGAGIGCREPELSHKPSVSALLWEQPEMAQQRFGKVPREPH